MSNSPTGPILTATKSMLPCTRPRIRHYRTLVTNIKGHTRFSERLDFDAAFIYAHTEGTSNITTVPIMTVLPGTGEMVDEHLHR